MKHFETPKMEIVVFDGSNILSGSGETYNFSPIWDKVSDLTNG